jgi:D-alanyl-D-alanine carboxypeptidase
MRFSRKFASISVMAGSIFLALAACGRSQDSSSQSATSSGKPAAGEPAYVPAMMRAMTKAMKDNAVPGIVILVRSPKGDWSTVLGTAEIGTNKPWTLNDHFRIGSNTKTMTGTVILQLAQEGKLALTDPVAKYIPGVPNGDKITIANLAEMRSGLFSYTSDAKFNQTLDQEPKKAWTPAELLRIGFSHPVNAAPDTEFEYSNTNTVLLGLIIEKVTGMSASEAFRKRIFEPLGLKQTSLPLPAEWALPDPHPQGYQFLTNAETIDSYAVPKDKLAAALDGTFKPLNYTDASPSWAWTAGGATSTAGELATYVKALVGGGLLDAKMQKIRFKSIRPITSGAGYGLGIAQFGPMYGHDGQLPGFSSFMAYDPKTQTTLIIGANLSAEPTHGANAATELAKAAMGVLYGSAVVAPGDPAAKD